MMRQAKFGHNMLASMIKDYYKNLTLHNLKDHIGE